MSLMFSAFFLTGTITEKYLQRYVHHKRVINMNFTTIDEKQRSLLALQLAERSTTTIVLETVTTLVLGLVGIVGNSLVCTAVYRNTRLQTKSNYYVASLAVLDMLQTVFGVVLVLPVLVLGRWSFSDMVCQLEGGVTIVLATASIYTMMLIAINRYFIMLRTNLYRKYFTKKMILVSIPVSWVIACNFAVSYSSQGFRYAFHPGKGICVFDVSYIPVTYGLLVGFFNVLLPFQIVSVCYLRIYFEVRKHKARVIDSSQSGQQDRRISPHDIKITKTLFVTVCAFAVCWLPFFIIDMIGLWYGPHALPRQLYMFYSFMAGGSSIVNPVIYGLMNRDFRREFGKTLHGLRCRKSSPREPEQNRNVAERP